MEMGMEMGRGMKNKMANQNNQTREEDLEAHLRKVFPDYDERRERVSRTEWQRWIPLFSLYRATVIDSVEDRVVRSSMHTKNYLLASLIYDLLPPAAATGYLFWQVFNK